MMVVDWSWRRKKRKNLGKEEEELGRGDERFNFGISVCDFVVYKGFGCFGVYRVWFMDFFRWRR